MTDKFKEQYQKLQSKLALPTYEQLDLEFDINSLEENNYPLRQVRLHISDIIGAYSKVIEELLQPESTLSSMYEYKVLEGHLKELVFNNYKEMMKLLRFSLEVSLKNTEADDAEFIKHSYKEWQPICKSLIPFAKKLKESWDQETIKKDDLGYLG